MSKAPRNFIFINSNQSFCLSFSWESPCYKAIKGNPYSFSFPVYTSQVGNPLDCTLFTVHTKIKELKWLKKKKKTKKVLFVPPLFLLTSSRSTLHTDGWENRLELNNNFFSFLNSEIEHWQREREREREKRLEPMRKHMYSGLMGLEKSPSCKGIV